MVESKQPIHRHQLKPLSRLLLNNIISPYGLALVSYTFFLFACLIPPSVYQYFQPEPDLMFLDLPTILFYTLCVGAFCSGIWLISWMFPARLRRSHFHTRISPSFFLLAPLAVGVAATAVTLYFVIAYHPDIILLLMTQKGAEIKEIVTYEVAGSVNLAPLGLTAIVWWTYVRLADLDLQGWGRRLVGFGICLAMVCLFIAATLLLSRDILMMSICGLMILFVIRRSKEKPTSFRFIGGTAAIIGGGVALLFLLFAFVRGSGNVSEQINQIVGYTVATYNRLAAVVNGRLRYPYAGRGLYLSNFLAFNHTWNQFVPLGRLMNWPDQLDVWQTEFSAVSRAGLNGTLVWSGTFGYIFSDLGWFSPIFTFGCGMLYGVVWRLFNSGSALGIVMYPCFGFCALFWFGSNILFDSQRAVVLVAALIVAGYEFVFLSPDRPI